MKKSREVSLDIIRVFAVFCVISVHFFLNNGFYENPVVGKRMFVMSVMRSFFMICVPLFLVLTGFLMSTKELNKRYYFGIVKTLGIYVLSSICCILFKRYYLNVEYGLKRSIVGILDYSAATYAWYIEMYIGLFLLIPFLNLIYKGLKTKQQKQILLITLLFLTSFCSLTGSIIDYKILPEYWVDFYPITLFFLGSYLKEFEVNISIMKSCLVLAGCALIAGSINYYRSYGTAFIWGKWSSFNSTLVIMMTILVFLIIKKIKVWNKLSDFWKIIIKWMSDCALGAYLLSYIFDILVYSYFSNRVEAFSYKIEYYFVCVPIVFGCSIVASWILNILYNKIFELMTKLVNVMRNKFAY